MNFLNGFTQIKRITSVFSSSDNQNKPVGVQPKPILYLRYVARLAILGLALFILLWWPAKDFTTGSFNDWSAKMTALPSQVWYLLLSIILSWGVHEIYTARNTSSPMPNMTDTDNMEDDSAVNYTDSDLDGRFSNLNDEDDFLSGPAQPNSVIENWRNNENK